MKTVLVIYEKWVDAPHALLEDYKVTLSEIVEVENLTDLNEKFKNIKEVKILEEKQKANFYCKNKVFVENYRGKHCIFQCSECSRNPPNI